MNGNVTLKASNSYLFQFEKAQINLLKLIQEQRMEKRIRRSRQRLQKVN